MSDERQQICLDTVGVNGLPYLCTEPEGHEGDHIARRWGGIECARWANA